MISIFEVIYNKEIQNARNADEENEFHVQSQNDSRKDDVERNVLLH